jgi:hypothetical protein
VVDTQHEIEKPPVEQHAVGADRGQAAARKSSFIVPGGLPITARVTGNALTVLHIVVSDWPPT